MPLDFRKRWRTSLSNAATPNFSSVTFSRAGFLFRERLVWTYSHNGNENDYNLFPDNLTDEQWLNHDRISRAKLLDLGANIGYSFNRSTSVVVGVGHSVGGANTHLRALVVSVGFVKAFTTRLAIDEASETASLPQASKALVCTCAKSK